MSVRPACLSVVQEWRYSAAEGLVGLVDGRLVNGDNGAETSVWDANNTRGLGAQQGGDGDDDSDNSTMTRTMTMRTRAGGVVRAVGAARYSGGGDGRGMFCVVRLSYELRMQKAQGKAGTSSSSRFFA